MGLYESNDPTELISQIMIEDPMITKLKEVNCTEFRRKTKFNCNEWIFELILKQDSEQNAFDGNSYKNTISWQWELTNIYRNDYHQLIHMNVHSIYAYVNYRNLNLNFTVGELQQYWMRRKQNEFHLKMNITIINTSYVNWS